MEAIFSVPRIQSTFVETISMGSAIEQHQVLLIKGPDDFVYRISASFVLALSPLP